MAEKSLLVRKARCSSADLKFVCTNSYLHKFVVPHSCGIKLKNCRPIYVDDDSRSPSGNISLVGDDSIAGLFGSTNSIGHCAAKHPGVAICPKLSWIVFFSLRFLLDVPYVQRHVFVREMPYLESSPRQIESDCVEKIRSGGRLSCLGMEIAK